MCHASFKCLNQEELVLDQLPIILFIFPCCFEALLEPKEENVEGITLNSCSLSYQESPQSKWRNLVNHICLEGGFRRRSPKLQLLPQKNIIIDCFRKQRKRKEYLILKEYTIILGGHKEKKNQWNHCKPKC